MIEALRLFTLVLAISNVAVEGAAGSQAQRSAGTQIKVIVRVDSEGPEGLQAQDATDLSPAELTQVRTLIRTEIAKLKDHVLVGPDEKGEVVGLLVVAAKHGTLSNRLILLSSAITIAKPDGTDVFVSHDVIAAESLERAAKAVAFYLTSVEFRTLLEMILKR